MKRILVILCLFVVIAASGLALWTSRDRMRINRARFHQIQENHPQAIATLEPLALHPPHHRALSHLIESYLALDQRGELDEVFDAIIAEYPDWSGPPFEHAKLLLRDGNWPEAWPLMVDAMRFSDFKTGSSPMSFHDNILGDAVVHLSDENADDALEMIAHFSWDDPYGPLTLEHIRTHDSDDSDLAALVAGLAHFQLGEWDAAAQSLNESLELFPDNPLTASTLALTSIAQGQWPLARHQFNVARSIDSELADALVIDELKQILDLNSEGSGSGISRAFALNWLCDHFANAEQWSEIASLTDNALAQFFTEGLDQPILPPRVNTALSQTAAAHQPEIPWHETPLPRGNLPDGMGWYGERNDQLGIYGETEFEMTIEAETSGWHWLALQARGRPSNGIFPLVEIATATASPEYLHIDSTTDQLHLARLHLDAGPNTARIAYVNDLERADRNSDRSFTALGLWTATEPTGAAAFSVQETRPLRLLAQSLETLDRQVDAMRILRDAAAQRPDLALPHFAVAVRLLRAGEWETAWPLMGWALSAEERTCLDDRERAIALATMALGDGFPSEALRFLGDDVLGDPLEPPRQAHPTNDLAQMLRAMALIRLGEWSGAAAPLDQAIALDPTNPLTRAMLAMAHVSRGEWHQARRQADVAKALGPSVASTFIIDELIRQIRMANESAAPGQSGAGIPRETALAWLAWDMAEAQEWADIIALIEPQPSRDRLRSAAVWQMLGRAHFYSDEMERQAEARERAFALDPSWPLDPDWPLPVNEIDPFLYLDQWDEIALPVGDAMPAESSRYGASDEIFSLYSDAEFDLTVEVEQAGWYRLATFARGQASNGIWPLLEISVPGTPPTSKYLNNHWEEFQISHHFLTEGSNTIRFAYVNDTEFTSSNHDRLATILGVWVEPTPFTEVIP